MSNMLSEDISDSHLSNIKEELMRLVEGKISWKSYFEDKHSSSTSIYFNELVNILTRDRVRYFEARTKIEEQPNVVKEFDNFGTLLHYAVEYGNHTIVESFIKLGGDIDHLCQTGSTALVLAVRAKNLPIIEILLNHGADITIADFTGKNALQLVFEQNDFNSHTIEIFMRQLQAKTDSIELLAFRLIAAGGNIYHAAHLGNVNLIKFMLDYEIDINSRDFGNNTGLHVAAEMNDCNMAKYLVSNGADVNALNKNGNSALSMFVFHKNKDIVNFLLQQGADPNSENHFGNSPLHSVFVNLKIETAEDCVECAELLLQFGANLENCEILPFTFHYLESSSRNYGNDYLIAYSAMLEMKFNKLKIHFIYTGGHYLEEPEHENFHESCQRVLKHLVFKEMSLFDLLQFQEDKMKLLVRSEIFVSEVKKNVL